MTKQSNQPNQPSLWQRIFKATNTFIMFLAAVIGVVWLWFHYRDEVRDALDQAEHAVGKRDELGCVWRLYLPGEWKGDEFAILFSKAERLTKWPVPYPDKSSDVKRLEALRAQRLLSERDYGEAVRVLQPLYSRNKDPNLGVDYTFALFKDGQMDKARTELETLEASRQRDACAEISLANVYLGMGELKKAEQLLRGQTSQTFLIYNTRAHLYLKRGELDRAKTEFERAAADYDPEDPDNLLQLAEVIRMQAAKQEEQGINAALVEATRLEAKRRYEAAFQLKDKYGQSHDAASRGGYGCVLMQVGRYAEARQVLYDIGEESGSRWLLVQQEDSTERLADRCGELSRHGRALF